MFLCSAGYSLQFSGLWVINVLVCEKEKEQIVTVENFQHLIKMNILRLIQLSSSAVVILLRTNDLLRFHHRSVSD